MYAIYGFLALQRLFGCICEYGTVLASARLNEKEPYSKVPKDTCLCGYELKNKKSVTVLVENPFKRMLDLYYVFR